MGNRRYVLRGQVFFASFEVLVSELDFHERVRSVQIDLYHAHFWDITAIDALDRIVNKCRHNGIGVDLHGVNRPLCGTADGRCGSEVSVQSHLVDGNYR